MPEPRVDPDHRIYLDHAATTPLAPEAAAAMRTLIDALADAPANPSSIHAHGRHARGLLDDARERVAAVLGARPAEIVFTGGGSEGANLAIFGVARARGTRGGHAITAAAEHHTVLHAFDVLQSEGWEVTVLPVDGDGRVRPADFAAALRPDTALASIMLVNNEVGAVNPIAELAAMARANRVVFHTDAVQAPGLVPLTAASLEADLISIAAHKFGGPAGAGALYVRPGTVLAPLVVGGGQERGRRAGTENLIGITGLVRALELAAANLPTAPPRIATLRDQLEAAILAAIPGSRRNGGGSPRAPHITSIAFPGVDGEALVAGLDLAGIAVSQGSACAAGSVEPSHVLAAIGAPAWAQRRTIRFSLGPRTTASEIERTIGRIATIAMSAREADECLT